MAGIYIHIPFCSKKCNYCDFYSIVPIARKSEFVDALISEIVLRKSFLEGEIVETVYFGGGTPSLLEISELNKILNTIAKENQLSGNLEITFEANPENLSREYIQALKQEGVNRLSIGTQSFVDSHLQFLKRTHNAKEAVMAVNNAFSLGIENISIDLIYGLPNLTDEEWKRNLKQAFDLPIKHLSSYHLTYEEGTLLYKRMKQGKVIPINEDSSINQFKILIDNTSKYNFEHYEISNFAPKGYYSKHNLSYWQQKKYLGLGPSAHSYNGIKREWNVSNLVKYIEGIQKKNRICSSEVLSDKDIANEYLITNLRTKWGINKLYFQAQYTQGEYQIFNHQIMELINQGLLKEKFNNIVLTEEGMFLSDLIIEKLYKI